MTREAMAKVTGSDDPTEAARLELQRAMEKDRRAAVEGQREIAEKRAAAAELIVHEANNARLKELLDAARDQATTKDIQSAKQRFAEAKDDWEAAQETRDRLARDERRMASAAAMGADGWASRFGGSTAGNTDMASARQVAVRLGVVAAVLAVSAALYFWALAPSDPDVGSASTAVAEKPVTGAENAPVADTAAASPAVLKPDAPVAPVPVEAPAATAAPVVLTTTAVPTPAAAASPPAGTVPAAVQPAPRAQETAAAPSTSPATAAKPVAAQPTAAKPASVASAIPAPPPVSEPGSIRVLSGPVPTPGRNPFRPETATPPVRVIPKGGPILLLRPEVE